MQPKAEIDKLQFATFRIEGRCTDGSECVGTGFFVQTSNPAFPEPQLLLVTNKHVVADVTSAKLFFHEATSPGNDAQPNGQSLEILVNDFYSRWIPHPSPDIDLCIAAFGDIGEELVKKGKSVFATQIARTHIPSQSDLEELTAVEEVVMVGYPNGLWDHTSNFPIIRRGITASHPAGDFQGRPITVIDAACFPGSSGSPVFIYNNGMFRKAGSVSFGTRLLFLGVLFAGPTMDAMGEIVVSAIPTTNAPVSVTKLMIHLGYVIKARELIPLIDHMTELFLTTIRRNARGSSTFGAGDAPAK